MSDLRELYQEVILDHHKKPRNFRRPADANRHAEGFNPLCGDKISLWLKMDGDTVQDVGFQGSGCAISTASASMMTERVKGKSKEEAEAIFHQFHDLVTGKAGAIARSASKAEPPELGKLEVFSGVREFPMRVKCATLAWHTMHSALNGEDKMISTE